MACLRSVFGDGCGDNLNAIARTWWPVALSSVASYAMQAADLAVVGHLLPAEALTVCLPFRSRRNQRAPHTHAR